MFFSSYHSKKLCNSNNKNCKRKITICHFFYNCFYKIHFKYFLPLFLHNNHAQTPARNNHQHTNLDLLHILAYKKRFPLLTPQSNVFLYTVFESSQSMTLSASFIFARTSAISGKCLPVGFMYVNSPITVLVPLSHKMR